MATLYLSYKSEEKPLAEALAQELSRLKHRPVYDAYLLAPGGGWRDVLMTALAGADAVVPLLSERALQSPWVMGEIGAARALQHMAGRMLLMPVLVGDVGLPDVVRDVFIVRMPRGEADVPQVAAAISAAVQQHLDGLARNSPRIFVSHRHVDVAVAQALVRLLEAAFVVTPSDLRCTSVPPYKLRAGDRTVDRLRSELRSAEAVLGILTPDIKASSYVLFELGASWGRSSATFPLLARGALAGDVPAPIGDLHTLSLADASECHQLLDDLADVVSLRRQNQQGSLVGQRIAELVAAATG